MQIVLLLLGIKMTKKILCVIRSSPYGNSHAQEALDIILSALTLDQTVSVAFIDDGVWQLKAQQHPQLLQQKPYTSIFKALPLYGIANLYVEQDSLTERQLQCDDLLMPVNMVSRSELAQLLTEQNILFSF